MALEWNYMAEYVTSRGWTTVAMREKGLKVLAWEHKETGRYCQDLEDAYHCEHYKQRTK